MDQLQTHLGCVQHIGVPDVSWPEVQLACFPGGQDTEHELHAAVAGALHDVPGAGGKELPPVGPPATHEHMPVQAINTRLKNAAGRMLAAPLFRIPMLLDLEILH